MIKGRKVANTVKQAMVVAGSGWIKKQTEAEGLDKIFTERVLNGVKRGCSMFGDEC